MGEVFIELQRNGAYLKCTATDADTGEEAVAFGPPDEAESLKQIAVQKLRNKLGSKPDTPKGGGRPSSGTDIKV